MAETVYESHLWVQKDGGDLRCEKCGETWYSRHITVPNALQYTCRGRPLRSEDFGRGGAAIEAAAASEQIAALETRAATAEAALQRANAEIAGLRRLLDGCSRCDHDEGEGGIVNHCDACCRKITTWVCAHWSALAELSKTEKRA